jgi:hypothetical protein
MREIVTKPGSASLAALLSEHKNAMVAKWLQLTLTAYQETSAAFLSQPADPFRNPVGYTLREGLSVLFEAAVQSTAAPAMQAALDGIIRIRAVQDIPAARALAFIFLLKRIVRADFTKDCMQFPSEIEAMEARIDEIALLAFEIFVQCREQIAGIKANESKRRAFLVDRINLKKTTAPVKDTR